MIEAPCKDCEDRELGCHSHCIAYLRYKAELDEVHKKSSEDAEMRTLIYQRTFSMKKKKTNCIRSDKF